MNASKKQTPAEVVDGYLTAFYSGDFDTAAGSVAEGFSFEGPFVSVDGKEAFFASAQGLRPVVRGHRLLRRWQDGDEICSIFELEIETPKGSAAIPMCEWNRVCDGELVSGRVLFDSAALRELLPTR
jgi:SnoaL-like domain